MLKCTPIKENITVYEGDDCTLDFTSSIGDLTGYSVKLQARIETSSRYAIIDSDGIVTDATKGGYSVTLPSAITLGKAQDDAYFYDIKLTAPDGSIHTDRSGMFTIDARTSDLNAVSTVTVYGVDVDKDGVSLLAKARELNFEGSGVTVSTNSKGGVDVNIQSPATSPTLALHFSGIYDDLQALQDTIPKPGDHMQAIVISPSEKYYHGVGGSWVELAPVGAFHPTYLGAYDNVSDLESANPTPAPDALAIVGTTVKSFYFWDGSDWGQLSHTDLQSLNARVTDAESKLSKAQSNLSGLLTSVGKNTADVAAIYAPSKAVFDAKLNARLTQPEADISALQAKTAQTDSTVSDNTDRINTAEQHLQTLQAGQGVLQSNMDQKISGIHVEDDEGNAFDDINSLTIEGGTVTDDGSQTAHIVIKPKITVANGQKPDSVSLMGNALVFPDATLSADPNDANVLIIGRTDTPAFNPSMFQSAVDHGYAADDQGVDRIIVNPRSFEEQHAASCLLQLDTDVTIHGGSATRLYTSHEIIPTGEYYSLDPAARGVAVQDNTGGDTEATGGELTRIMASVGFYGKAPDNCNVKIWIWYKDPASSLNGGILNNVNGRPMLVERYYNQGDDMSEALIITGAMMATGWSPVVMYVESSAGTFVIDPSKTMLCLEQFSDGFETSLASIEFERRLAVSINAEIKPFTTQMLSLANEVRGLSEPETVLPANSGGDYLNDFGVRNLTEVKSSIADDAFNVSDNGNITDFYVDTVIDNTKTFMLLGKEIQYSVIIKDPRDGWRLEIYKWTGGADQAGRVYDSRNNGSLNVNAGFTLVKSKFISENITNSFHTHSDTVTVPDDAVNLIIILRPVEAQSPIELSVKDFTWSAVKPFTGYRETSRTNLNEIHFELDAEYMEYYCTDDSGQGVRYTIGNTVSGNPMPVGLFRKGKAPIDVDHTVNTVPGSAYPNYDGGLKFTKAGEVTVSKSYNVFNEQGTDNTVTFWDILITIDGNESVIDDSKRTFTIPKNTGAPGVIYSIPAYTIEVEAGQRIASRASSNKDDGAYVASANISELLSQTVVNFKEEVVTQNDDPDLVNAPIPKANVFDRRVYSFSGNTLQNIVIDLEVPSDVELAEIEVVKHSGVTTTSIKDCEYAYDSDTQKLTVHVGLGVVEGKVYLTFWSGIA